MKATIVRNKLRQAKHCERCASEIVGATPRTKYCKECLSMVIRANSKAKADKRTAESYEKRKAALVAAGAIADEYIGQSLSVKRPRCYSLSEVGRGSRPLWIERTCMQCDRQDPSCGFAPAFNDLPLDEPAGHEDKIVLLCNECYELEY